MQFLIDVKQKAAEFAEANAAALLTAGGVVGTVATGVLSWRGGYKTGQKVAIEEQHRFETNLAQASPDEPEPLTKTDKIKLGAVDALAPILVGGLGVASTVMANRVSAQKAAALAAAYGLAERNLSEYKEKVAEKLTGPKKQQLEAEISQDRVNRTDGYQNVVVIDGEVLCFDEPTGRYFRSTKQKIDTAVNAINAEIIESDWASASQFYEELGLPATTWTDMVGWDHNHLVALKYDTVTSPDGRPCLAIDFKTAPRENWDPKID